MNNAEPLLFTRALLDASKLTQALESREPRTRRLGRFTVHCALMESWKVLLPLMAKVVVVRCEQIFDRDYFEYTAFSELFEEVPMGTYPPRYEILFTREGDTLTVRAEKMS